MTDARETRFEEIYARHERAVLAYFLRRTDPTSARDAAADTFLVAWRRIDDVPAADRVLPWLYGVARKVLANQRRSRDRFQALRRKVAGFGTGPSASPEAAVVRDAEAAEIRSAITRLRPSDQELVRLLAWEELSHAEAAAVLGTSPHAVSQRLYRVTKRLRHELTRGTDVALTDRPGKKQHPEATS